MDVKKAALHGEVWKRLKFYTNESKSHGFELCIFIFIIRSWFDYRLGSVHTNFARVCVRIISESLDH